LTGEEIMSGHSHWSTIKRKKGAADAKRGQVFTRLAREISLAAREGGGDPETNFRLAIAIDRAKSQNLPKDNIERAIKRGTGESQDGAVLEQYFYEGYANHGVAMMIEVVTDNRNRAVADIRHVLTKNGGGMADAGSVSWQFNRAAYFAIPAEGQDEDEIFELAVESGADDVIFSEQLIEIIGEVDMYKSISNRLTAAEIKPDESGMRMIPTNEIELTSDQTMQVLRTIESLEDLDDVQEVYSNLNLPEEVLTQLEEF
jgi:YebC/PmpR family DNA-binding regulatory protein